MGEIAALAASVVWAAASLMFARVGRSTGALAMNLLKCGIALLLMLVTLALISGRIWPVSLPAWETGLLAASGIVGLTLGDTLYFAALTRLAARRTLLLLSLAPPFTALMAWPALGEPLTLKMVTGMSVTLAGVAWVITERHTTDDSTVGEAQSPRDTGHTVMGLNRFEWIGVGAGVGAAACQAGANVLIKEGGISIGALEISIVRLTFGVMGLAIFLRVMDQLDDITSPFTAWRPAGLIVGATLIGTYLGVWLKVAGVRYTEFTGIASTLSSTSPVFVLPMAWFFDREELSGRSVLGAFVAVAGIALLFVPW